MRRFLAPIALVLSLPLCAQEPSPRFAFFNLAQLVESSTKAKKVFVELEVTQKNLREKLEAKAGEGQALQRQLQSGTLSDQGREQVQKQLRDLEFEFKKMQEDSQGELNKIQQRVMGQLSQMVGPIIEVLAKEQKLQVVFAGEQAGQMIAWAEETWIKNFTSEVAKRLDAQPEGAGTPKTGDKPAPKTAPSPKAGDKPAPKPAAGKK